MKPKTGDIVVILPERREFGIVTSADDATVKIKGKIGPLRSDEVETIVAGAQNAFPAGCEAIIVQPRCANARPQFSNEMREYIGRKFKTKALDNGLIQLGRYYYRPSWIEQIPFPGIIETKKCINDLLSQIF